jgi:hypothetical protein
VIGVEGDENRVWWVERCSGTRMRSSFKVLKESKTSHVSIQRFLAMFSQSQGS